MPIKTIYMQSAALIGLLFVLFIGTKTLADETDTVIRITAKKFEYSPGSIVIKRGIPVIIELTSLDVVHGFSCPELGIRSDIKPGQVSRIRVMAQKAGIYKFHCDVFCGEGHDEMSGEIIVKD